MLNPLKKYHFLIFSILLFFTGACSGDPWSKNDKNTLLDRCIAEGGTKSYCKCYLENAMAAYPNADSMEKIDFESAVELSKNCPQ